MQIARAKELAEQHGMTFKQNVDYTIDLFGVDGKYIDTLYHDQIGEMQEDDYSEFYLDVPPIDWAEQ